MGPARFHCAPLLLMKDVLKFNYALDCFPRIASKDGPLILCTVPSCRNEIGSFRLDYEYEIEYEYDFRISNQ